DAHGGAVIGGPAERDGVAHVQIDQAAVAARARGGRGASGQRGPSGAWGDGEAGLLAVDAAVAGAQGGGAVPAVGGEVGAVAEGQVAVDGAGDRAAVAAVAAVAAHGACRRGGRVAVVAGVEVDARVGSVAAVTAETAGPAVDVGRAAGGVVIAG